MHLVAWLTFILDLNLLYTHAKSLSTLYLLSYSTIIMFAPLAWILSCRVLKNNTIPVLTQANKHSWESICKQGVGTMRCFAGLLTLFSPSPSRPSPPTFRTSSTRTLNFKFSTLPVYLEKLYIMVRVCRTSAWLRLTLVHSSPC